jgi:hypothetical protein
LKNPPPSADAEPPALAVAELPVIRLFVTSTVGGWPRSACDDRRVVD